MPEFVKATADKYALPGTICGTVLGDTFGFVYHAIKHFVDCVLDGREPMVTGADGLALTKTLCAIVESAEREEPVIVE